MSRCRVGVRHDTCVRHWDAPNPRNVCDGSRFAGLILQMKTYSLRFERERPREIEAVDSSKWNQDHGTIKKTEDGTKNILDWGR